MILRVTDHAIYRARKRFKVTGSRYAVQSEIFGVLFKAKPIKIIDKNRQIWKSGFWLLVLGFSRFEIVVITVLINQKAVYLCNNTE